MGHCSWVGSWWKLIIEALQPEGTSVHPPLECTVITACGTRWFLSSRGFMCVNDGWYLCNVLGRENHCEKCVLKLWKWAFFLIWNIINSSPSKVHDDMEWSSSSYSMSKYFLATLAVWIIWSVHHSDSDLDVSITIGSTDMKFSYRYSWFPDDHSYWLQGSFLASCTNMRLIFVIFSQIDLQ